MTIDWTKPIEARWVNGPWCPARVLCTDRKAVSRFPVVLLVEDGMTERAVYAQLDGTSGSGSCHVRNVPPKPVPFEFTRWVNVYRRVSGEFVHGGCHYDSREFAEREAGGRHVTVPITIRGEWPAEENES